MDFPDDDVDNIARDGPPGTGIACQDDAADEEETLAHNIATDGLPGTGMGCQDDAAVAEEAVAHMSALLLLSTALVQANVTRRCTRCESALPGWPQNRAHISPWLFMSRNHASQK